MRKIYSILLALLMLPVFAVGQTNMAISKSYSTNYYYSNRSETRILVPFSAVEMGQEKVNAGDPGYDFSVGMWFKTTAVYSGVPYAAVLFRMGTGNHANNNGSMQVLQAMNTGALTFTFGGDNFDGNTGSGASLGTAPLANEWHHLLLVFDSTNGQLTSYLDGEQTYQGASAKFGYVFGDGVFQFFGANQTGAFDEIQLFSKALNADEAALAYVNAKAVNGLASLFTFDEVVDGTTGQFASVAGSVENAVATYQNCLYGNYYSDSGLVNLTSATETTPTLVEGREMPEEEVIVMIEDGVGGTISVTDGTTTWTEADGEFTTTNKTQLTVTATPDPGYNLLGVYAVDYTTAAQTEIGSTFIPSAAMTLITARYTNATYTLTVNNEQELPYAITYKDEAVEDLTGFLGGGAEYKLTVTVPNDKVLNEVRLGDEVLTADNKGVYTFTMDADATLTIDARAKARYTVTFNQPEGGTVGATYAAATGAVAIASGDQVIEGTELTLTNTPETGHKFISYSVEGGTLNDGKVIANADLTISGVFEEGVEYCTPTTTTSQSRHYMTSLILSDGESSVTVTGNGSSGTRSQYVDRTSTVFTTKAGAEITVTLSAAGTWMHNYLYIDYGNDGVFDVDPSKTEVNGDLVSHTGYQTSMKSDRSDTADPTTCSDGFSLNNNAPWAHFPSFTIPADLAPGTYRVRFKMDWNSVDPCGRDNSRLYTGQATNNGFTTHGTPMIDFTLVIESENFDEERTITVASENEEYGTVAITAPETEGTSVTTSQKNVTMVATAAEGYTFINWTDADGNEVSTDATYTYKEETDATFTAHFGCQLDVNYTDGAVVITVDGQRVNNGAVLTPGSEVVLEITAPDGKTTIVEIDGQTTVVENGTYTIESLDKNTVVNITYEDKIIYLNIVVVGNGTVECYTECPDADGEVKAGVQLENGATINNYRNEDLHFWFIPGETAAGDPEEFASATFAYDGEDAVELSKEDDLFDLGDGTYYTPITVEDGLTLTVIFTENGTTQGIAEIGIDPADGPVEYYNLQGVRVAAENLTSGFYVIRQGSKAVKVFIKK